MSYEGLPNASATSPQEQLLLALNAGFYEPAIDDVVDKLRSGLTPGFLSTLRTDLLVGFAQSWRTTDLAGNVSGSDSSYKSILFDTHHAQAVTGDPAMIEALAKFATTESQLTTAMELLLDYRQEVSRWHSDRHYVQFLGTFDPQHIGHRIALSSTLAVMGDEASALVHVMEQHPLKPSFSHSYAERCAASEKRLYRSSLLDTARVTQVDVPGGIGLANCGVEQMRLLADISGDRSLRWLIGSDKLEHDTAAIRLGVAAVKAVRRFSEPRLHAYVIRRQFDEVATLQNDVDYVTSRFGVPVTVIEELPYDCAPASSSRIKELRAEGRNTEADHMELYDTLS